MTSIFENTHSKVTIHILHDETLTRENKQRFICTAEKYSHGLEFHDITEYKYLIGDTLTKITKIWTIGTLYRMFIPDVIPSCLDKVIYLDCDILVNLDIRELWEINLEDKSIAGALDPLHYAKSSPTYYQIKLVVGSAESYINAGVTIMNLRKIREIKDFCGICVDWLLKHSHFRIFPDQDMLNAIFLNDIKIIDPKFNVFADIHNTMQDISDKIIHVNGSRSKPWKYFYGCQHDHLYWKMFLRSAWGQNITPEELIDIFCNLTCQSPLIHASYKDCVKSILSKACNKFCGKFKIVGLIIKNMYYKFKYRFTHSLHTQQSSKLQHSPSRHALAAG